MKKNILWITLIVGISFFITQCHTQKDLVQTGGNYPKDSKENIRRDKVVNYAKKQIGVRYKYAGSSPKTGFDCSGYTKYVYAHFGYDLPRSSSAYSNIGKKINVKDCEKGDILLFTGSNKHKRVTGHLGIVVSNKNGTIKFIHASSSRGVMISDLSITYFKERILGARRIIK
jgi:cell wall-associated NlpC family hydrolase